MAQKLPYTNFYWKDFWCDPKVVAMTWEQRAFYLRLLWAAWEEEPAGTLPCDDDFIIEVLGVTKARWLKSKDKVLAPFAFGLDGRWHQKRLKEEFTKAKERSDAARKNILKRWEKEREKDTDVLLNGNTIASALSSGSNAVSFPKRPDPNTFVPPSQPGTPINRKEPPFPNTDFWKYQDLKSAMRTYLAHVYEKWNWSLSHREFATLVYDLESEFRSSRAVEAALRRTVRKGIKNVQFPSETGEILKR